MQDAEPQVQWFASIILKNTLKDHLITLKEDTPDQISQIKGALMSKLNSSTGEVGERWFEGDKKLQQEFYFIVAGIIVKEFNSNAEDTLMFEEIIKNFSYNYNVYVNLFVNPFSHFLRVIIQTFEDANDDRFWKFVPTLLPITLHYLTQVLPLCLTLFRLKKISFSILSG